MKLFWEKGFEGTSMTDLTAAIGDRVDQPSRQKRGMTSNGVSGVINTWMPLIWWSCIHRSCGGGVQAAVLTVGVRLESAEILSPAQISNAKVPRLAPRMQTALQPHAL
jgi:hypothetical protein